MKTPHEKVQLALARTGTRHPFLFPIIGYLIIKEQAGLEVPMRIFPSAIHFNPEEIDNRTSMEIEWLVLHELMHIVMGHFDMLYKLEYQGSVVNISLFKKAADLAISYLIHSYPGRDTNQISIHDPEFKELLTWIEPWQLTMSIYNRLVTVDKRTRKDNRDSTPKSTAPAEGTEGPRKEDG